MTRHGLTLMELMASIMIASLVMTGVLAVLRPLQRLAAIDTARGVRAELACDQLRRDLLGGVPTAIPDGVQVQRGTQRILWQVAEGQLLRDARPMVAVTDFTQAQRAGRLVITLTPLGLSVREIEVQP